MKKYLLLFVAMAALILTAPLAHAVQLNWTNKTCVTVDGTFNVCKPNGKWDTQKHIKDSVVKWVFHKSGPNPEIKLIYNTDVSGKTAHDYAKRVIAELQGQGLKVSRVQNTAINGRNVTIMEANKASDKTSHLVAVYRDQHKGLWLWCNAGKEEYATWDPQFRTAIQSVKFVGQ